MHVRTLRGVIESRYHAANPSRNTDARAQLLGDRAVRYLAAHGYTTAAIGAIVDAWQGTSTNNQFAFQLAGGGMALAEAMYIYELIG